jgi:triosephosphate isomerase
MYHQAQGAFTGESSPAQLADLGCRYIIIGHSERRQIFNETDQEVSHKARAAHDHDLTPILCVGETLSEREAGQTLSRVLSQVDAAFSELSASEAIASICAYEPVWAIGTGRTATPDQAQEVHRAIRKRLAHRFSSEVADQIRLQYGGSVKPANAKALMSQTDIDGALVGGASLTAPSFLNILSQTVL